MPSNTTALIPCPQGETGFITRYCDLSGVWGVANTTQCSRRGAKR